jgi:hypothetical protein
MLNLRALCESERILDVHTEIADRALDLGVAEEDLHGAQVAGLFVDDGPVPSVSVLPRRERVAPAVGVPSLALASPSRQTVAVCV